MNLLLADLRSVANLPLTRAGRQQTAGLLVGLGLLATLSWWFAQAIVEHHELVVRLHLDRGDSQRALLGYGLMACPIVASWLGLAQGQRQLFEAPELALWRQAPIPPWRGAMQVLLRATFASTTWAAALGGPFLVAVLQQMNTPPWAWLLLPLAIVGATMPLLTTVLATQLVLVRFFAGRVLRLVLTAAGGLAAVGFYAWLLLTMFSRSGPRPPAPLTGATAGESLPWTVDQGAALLASAGRGVLAVEPLLGIAGWLALSCAIFWGAAHLHPRAQERQLAAEPPLWRHRGRRWPTSLAATVRKKELAQVLQQPGALIGFLLYALLVFVMTKQRVFVGGLLANDELPRDLVHFVSMLVQWMLAVLLVLYAHMGRLVLWDSVQWSLWVASPAAPGAILRGKLTAIFVLLLWPAALVAASGAAQLEASGPTLLAFAIAALGASFVAIGVIALVGTWPRLVRPGDAPQSAQGSRGFLAALLLVVTFQALTMVPAQLGLQLLEVASRRHLLTDTAVWRHAPLAIAALWLYGLAIAGLGVAVGTRNYRALLRPR